MALYVKFSDVNKQVSPEFNYDIGAIYAYRNGKKKKITRVYTTKKTDSGESEIKLIWPDHPLYNFFITSITCIDDNLHLPKIKTGDGELTIPESDYFFKNKINDITIYVEADCTDLRICICNSNYRHINEDFECVYEGYNKTITGTTKYRNNRNEKTHYDFYFNLKLNPNKNFSERKCTFTIYQKDEHDKFTGEKININIVHLPNKVIEITNYLVDWYIDEYLSQSLNKNLHTPILSVQGDETLTYNIWTRIKCKTKTLVKGYEPTLYYDDPLLSDFHTIDDVILNINPEEHIKIDFDYLPEPKIGRWKLNITTDKIEDPSNIFYLWSDPDYLLSTILIPNENILGRVRYKINQCDQYDTRNFNLNIDIKESQGQLQNNKFIIQQKGYETLLDVTNNYHDKVFVTYYEEDELDNNNIYSVYRDTAYTAEGYIYFTIKLKHNNLSESQYVISNDLINNGVNLSSDSSSFDLDFKIEDIREGLSEKFYKFTVEQRRTDSEETFLSPLEVYFTHEKSETNIKSYTISDLGVIYFKLYIDEQQTLILDQRNIKNSTNPKYPLSVTFNIGTNKIDPNKDDGFLLIPHGLYSFIDRRYTKLPYNKNLPGAHWKSLSEEYCLRVTLASGNITLNRQINVVIELLTTKENDSVNLIYGDDERSRIETTQNGEIGENYHVIIGQKNFILCKNITDGYTYNSSNIVDNQDGTYYIHLKFNSNTNRDPSDELLSAPYKLVQYGESKWNDSLECSTIQFYIEGTRIGNIPSRNIQYRIEYNPNILDNPNTSPESILYQNIKQEQLETKEDIRITPNDKICSDITVLYDKNPLVEYLGNNLAFDTIAKLFEIRVFAKNDKPHNGIDNLVGTYDSDFDISPSYTENGELIQNIEDGNSVDLNLCLIPYINYDLINCAEYLTMHVYYEGYDNGEGWLANIAYTGENIEPTEYNPFDYIKWEPDYGAGIEYKKHYQGEVYKEMTEYKCSILPVTLSNNYSAKTREFNIKGIYGHLVVKFKIVHAPNKTLKFYAYWEDSYGGQYEKWHVHNNIVSTESKIFNVVSQNYIGAVLYSWKLLGYDDKIISSVSVFGEENNEKLDITIKPLKDFTEYLNSLEDISYPYATYVEIQQYNPNENNPDGEIYKIPIEIPLWNPNVLVKATEINFSED